MAVENAGRKIKSKSPSFSRHSYNLECQNCLANESGKKGLEIKIVYLFGKSTTWVSPN